MEKRIRFEAEGIEVDGIEETMPILRETRDMFYYYSTLQGSVSWRNERNGSWMISELINVWEDKTFLEDDIARIATETNSSHWTTLKECPNVRLTQCYNVTEQQ